MKTKIVGILNITPDSFSDGGCFNNLESASNQLVKILNEGAKMIDIGAESTRPNAIKITAKEEWSRLELILPNLIKIVRNFNQNKNFDEQNKVLISLDSYHFDNLYLAYQLGVDVVNDVSGLEDKRTIDLIASKQIKTILMHNQEIKFNDEILINRHLNLTNKIINWASDKILQLENLGLKRDKIIFDPGIGFNKDAFASIKILKEIDNFRVLNVPLYVGHSRKSFLEQINLKDKNNQVLDRNQKTILISQFLARKNIEYIRVHDVYKNILAISDMS
ncbi:MAG: dihydropteroate synthase [Rickettsiales bacterium]|jgi:dihydropteroate synthase|nr:dihydropteroate synthase [Rickettsiales bacterium]